MQYPGYFDIHRIRACTTIGEFDDAYIAPIYGFKDKFHYYRNSGSKWWLPSIRVPVVAINAIDDPFILESTLPTAEDVGEIAPVRLIYHSHGGHCGFYTSQAMMGLPNSSDSDSDRISTSNSVSVGVVEEDYPVPGHGWLAEELARAINHIHNATA